MRSRVVVAATLVSLALAAAPARAKRHKPAPAAPAASAPKATSPETMKAIEKLMGKFKWGMSSDDAMKVIAEGISAEFDARIDATRDPFKQDAIRKEEQAALKKMRDSYVKFDGQRTGWDVSLVDSQFAHGDDEAMVVIWEKNQRRFLFFWQDKLYKQFIAFNADHPVFQGKSFDDFADIIQKIYGPASLTFKKKRTSDEQTFDHLEWQPPGDYLLWAVDQTNTYNSYCLELLQKSVVPLVDKSRADKGVDKKAAGGGGIVDAVLSSEKNNKSDPDKDVVDQITGDSDKDKDKDSKPADPIEGAGMQ